RSEVRRRQHALSLSQRPGCGARGQPATPVQACVRCHRWAWLGAPRLHARPFRQSLVSGNERVSRHDFAFAGADGGAGGGYGFRRAGMAHSRIHLGRGGIAMLMVMRDTLLGLLLLCGVAACTWSGLQAGNSSARRIYVAGELEHTDADRIAEVAAPYVQASFFDMD